MVFQWLLLILWGFSATYAQTSSCQDGSVRLVETASISNALNNAGLVQVCRNGVWGTVCADSLTTPWSEKNAQVVCKQMRYSGALNSIQQDTVNFLERPSDNIPIHYRSIHCTGEEDRLIDCPGISTATGSCRHTWDAYIVCRPMSGRMSPVHTASPQRGDIRLVADPDNGEGAVEFYHQSLGWSGICPDNNWGTSEAVVACMQLGYETGRPVTYTSNAISQRFLRISDCNEGMDIGLHNCTVTTISSTACSSRSGSYAGVQCSSDTRTSAGSVRLVGDSRSRGLVEVFYNGRWGPVCSSSWGTTEARLVCGELGFNRNDGSRYTSPGAGIETNLKPIWLTNVDCSSSGQQLRRDCDYRAPIGFVNNCVSFAGADCTPEPLRLSSGSIAGIVVGILVFIGGLTGLWFGYGKERWAKRNSYPWYQNMSQWCSTCHCDCHCPRPRPQSSTPARTTELTVTVPQAVPQETVTMTLNSNLDTSESETEPPPQRPDAELTKAAPPSYHAASDFPTGDPLKAPPADLPPPYPGPPIAQATAGYPQAGLGFSPLAPNYQGYPPPTNPAYPTAYPPGVVPSLELAYPPNIAPSNTDTQHQSGVDTITPYPVDTIPPDGADQQ